MKKVLLVFGAILLLTISALAQDDEYPKFELSGTASMLIADIDILGDETMWGYGIGGQVNANKWFGIVGEWDTNHGASGPWSLAQDGAIYAIPELDTRVQTLLFGPRVSVRTKPITVFGHVLLGAGTNKLDDNLGAFDYKSYTAWQYAMAIGGGVDVNLGKNFAIRAAQFDYVLIDSDLQNLTGPNAPVTAPGMYHSFRYKFGAVFKF